MQMLKAWKQLGSSTQPWAPVAIKGTLTSSFQLRCCTDTWLSEAWPNPQDLHQASQFLQGWYIWQDRDAAADLPSLLYPAAKKTNYNNFYLQNNWQNIYP